MSYKEGTYLEVPYKQQDEAKSLGAWWDPTLKLWYIPRGRDVAPALKKWRLHQPDQALSMPCEACSPDAEEFCLQCLHLPPALMHRGAPRSTLDLRASSEQPRYWALNLTGGTEPGMCPRTCVIGWRISGAGSPSSASFQLQRRAGACDACPEYCTSRSPLSSLGGCHSAGQRCAAGARGSFGLGASCPWRRA